MNAADLPQRIDPGAGRELRWRRVEAGDRDVSRRVPPARSDHMRPAHWTRRGLGSAAAALFTALSCGGTPTQPSDIHASLDLSRDEVVAGESFVATLLLTNPTDDAITLGSPMGCLALPSIHRDGERLNWAGTEIYCLAIEGHHRIPARATRTIDFNLKAALRQPSAPFDYVVPAAPGVYELRMEMEVDLPDTSATIRVIG